MFAQEGNKKTPSADENKTPANHSPAEPKSAPQPNTVWQTLSLSPLTVQPKLSMSQPGDVTEQEADRVANEVMRTATPTYGSSPVSVFSLSPEVSVEARRKCDPCEKEENGLERKGDNPRSTTTAPGIVNEGLSVAGQPLDDSTREFMESRFGSDLGHVRIHTDSGAAESARAISALAYTVGSDVVFGPNQYAPTTAQGKALLAHELAHTLRQTGRKTVVQRQVDPSQPPTDSAQTRSKSTETTEETTSVTLSRGVLQMTSEGDFTESDTSVKRPHFPFNVNVFKKLTDAEIKTYDDAKAAADAGKKKNPKAASFTKPYQRFGSPNENGVLKEDDNGHYKMGALKDRHDTATYSAKLETDEQLGTTNSSGVTIGFGIDLGNRYAAASDAKKDFKAAGIIDEKGAGVGDNKADKLLEGVGLKGIKAAEKAASLRNDGVHLTVDQVLKLLNVVIPAYDKTAYTKGYSKGDGTLHGAIEEVLMAFSYWGGNEKVRKAIIKNAKGKEGAEQFRAAAQAIKDNKSSAKWMQRGYQIYISFLELLAEMKDAGTEVKMAGSVSSEAAITGAKDGESDSTLQFVKDLSERVTDYKTAGKDLKKQMTGTALPDLITDKVGEGKAATNNENDVKLIQQFLYNGNYDVEVTGKYDDKTKAAIEKFMKDEFGKSSSIIDPGGKALRRLKKFQYLKRSG